MQLSRLWTEGRHELPALPLSALREGRWQPSGELSLPRLRKGWWKAFRLLLLSGVRRGRLTGFEFRKARTRLREMKYSPILKLFVPALIQPTMKGVARSPG